MRGLAFEGGGAKGAYQIGVVKALLEKGYKFDGFVGTSMGAVNAAVIAQGDFDKAIELWMNISIVKIFERDAFLEKYIDEEKIRESGSDFGLVTISLSDRKPYELMLKDIPHGQLVSYVMASASLPVFGTETIDEKKYIDGAFYNNCPVNLLMEKGYDEIIVIRTNALGVFRRIDDPRVTLITPKVDLGNTMLFTHENIAENLKFGYYDGLRFSENLRGSLYYILPVDADKFNLRVMSLPDSVMIEAGKLLGIRGMEAKRMFFEKIIPQLGAFMKLDKKFDYVDFVIALLEFSAEHYKIERLYIYDYDELRSLVKSANETEKIKEPHVLSRILNSSAMKKKAAIKLLSEYLL